MKISKNEISQELSRLLRAIGIAFIIGHFNPFGLVSGADNALAIRVEQVIILLFKGFGLLSSDIKALITPNNQTLKETENLKIDNITVLLIGDADLAVWKENWPPNYNQYKAILDELVSYEGVKPKAIYFGIPLEKRNYNGKYPDVEKLANKIATISESIPVIMTTPHDTAGNADKVKDILDNKLQGSEKPNITWVNDFIKRDMYRPDVYPLELLPNQIADSNLSSRIKTPAFGIYKAVCKETSDCESNKDTAPKGIAQKPLIIDWHTQYENQKGCNAQNNIDAIFSADTKPRACPINCHILSGLAFFSELMFQPSSTNPPPPFLTLNGSHFKTASRTSNRYIQEAISGKIVMIGYDLKMNYSKSPLYPQGIPYIYVHAMALENLLRLSTSYQTGLDKNTIAQAFLKIGLFFLGFSLAINYIIYGFLKMSETTTKITKTYIKTFTATAQRKTNSLPLMESFTGLCNLYDLLLIAIKRSRRYVWLILPAKDSPQFSMAVKLLLFLFLTITLYFFMEVSLTEAIIDSILASFLADLDFEIVSGVVDKIIGSTYVLIKKATKFARNIYGSL